MTLDELKKLCDEATPGPWSIALSQNEDDTEADTYHLLPWDLDAKDAKFIAAARTYMPLLIAVADAAFAVTQDPDLLPEDCNCTIGRLSEALQALKDAK